MCQDGHFHVHFDVRISSTTYVDAIDAYGWNEDGARRGEVDFTDKEFHDVIASTGHDYEHLVLVMAAQRCEQAADAAGFWKEGPMTNR